MLRRITGLAMTLVLALGVIATQTACDKPALIKNARRVSAALKEVAPILTVNGVSTARLNEAITTADGLIAALEGSGTDPATTLEIVSTLISQFNALVAQDVVRITNPATRTIVLVGLAVGNIALRNIADALAEEAANRPVTGGMGASAGRHAAVIRAFRAKPKWRCRNASSGRFAKMDYCKQFPANSVVETY